MLKKRSIIYHCCGCSVLQNPLYDLEGLKSSLVDHFKQELATFSDSLLNRMIEEVDTRNRLVLTELSNLKETNVDLLKFVDSSGFRIEPPKPLNTPASHTSANSTRAIVNTNQASANNAGSNFTPVVTTAGFQRLPSSAGPSSRGRQPDSDLHSVPSAQHITGRQISGGSRRSINPPRVNVNTHVVGSREVGADGISAAILQKRTSVLVGRLDKNVSASDLRTYLLSTFGTSEEFVIEEQTVKSGEYRSFRVEAKLDSLGSLMTPSNWPVGVIVKKFRFFRSRPPGARLSTSQPTTSQ